MFTEVTQTGMDWVQHTKLEMKSIGIVKIEDLEETEE